MLRDPAKDKVQGLHLFSSDPFLQHLQQLLAGKACHGRHIGPLSLNERLSECDLLHVPERAARCDSSPDSQKVAHLGDTPTEGLSWAHGEGGGVEARMYSRGITFTELADFSSCILRFSNSNGKYISLLNFFIA